MLTFHATPSYSANDDFVAWSSSSGSKTFKSMTPPMGEQYWLVGQGHPVLKNMTPSLGMMT